MVRLLKDEVDRYRSSISRRMRSALSEVVAGLSGDAAADTGMAIRSMNRVLSRIIKKVFYRSTASSLLGLCRWKLAFDSKASCYPKSIKVFSACICACQGGTI